MRLALLLVPGMWLCAAEPGFVVPYPPAPGSQGSSTYAVTVNGTPVFVHNRREVSYAHFAFAGEARVQVRVQGGIPGYDLSPHSYGIAASKEDNHLRFSLREPRKLLLRVDGVDELLCLFADPPEDDPPAPGQPGVKNILDHEIDNTGREDATAAIQKAIDELPEGGTLYFAPGVYSFTRIRFRSHRTFYLAPGSVLQASEDEEAMVSFNGCVGTTLKGRGTFDGKGYIHRARRGGKEGGLTFFRVDRNGGSRDVTIEDIVIKNAPIWTAILFDTERWHIYNLKIVNDRQYANRDGIDPHNSRHMTVENTFMYVSDDPIAYSTTRPGIALHSIVKNCVFFNNRSGCCIRHGPWIGNGTSDFTAENNDFIQGARNDWCIKFAASGNLSRFRYRNIRVENPGRGLIEMSTHWTNDHYQGAGSGRIEDVRFSNVSSPSGGSIVLKAPNPGNGIDGVVFDNFSWRGTVVKSAEEAEIKAGEYVRDLQFTAGEAVIAGIRATRPIASRDRAGEFTFERTGATGSPLELRFRIRGSARSGSDYAPLGSGSISIPAGAASAALRIEPLKEAWPEGFRTVFLTLEHDPEERYMLGPEFHATVTFVGADGPKP